MIWSETVIPWSFLVDHSWVIPCAFLVVKLPSLGSMRAHLLSLPGKLHNCTAELKAGAFSFCLWILWHIYTAGAAVMALWYATCTTWASSIHVLEFHGSMEWSSATCRNHASSRVNTQIVGRRCALKEWPHNYQHLLQLVLKLSSMHLCCRWSYMNLCPMRCQSTSASHLMQVWLKIHLLKRLYCL